MHRMLSFLAQNRGIAAREVTQLLIWVISNERLPNTTQASISSLISFSKHTVTDAVLHYALCHFTLITNWRKLPPTKTSNSVAEKVHSTLGAAVTLPNPRDIRSTPTCATSFAVDSTVSKGRQVHNVNCKQKSRPTQHQNPQRTVDKDQLEHSECTFNYTFMFILFNLYFTVIV